MDLAKSYDRFSNLADAKPPREIEVETANGVKGTIAVPHAVDNADFLKLGYAPPTRKLAIILHGQGGHRDYCYQKKLAHKMAAELGRTLNLDVEDLQAAAELVIDASKNPLGVSFDLLAIIAHSRGAIAMFLWALEQQKLLQDTETAASAIVVPSLVNCSLRFRSNTVLDRYPIYDTGFEYMEQKVLRHGKMQMAKIPRTELKSLADVDTARFAELSAEWSVLSVYGTEDTIIPKEDCAFFANIFNRGQYTHHLELLDGADHNFYGVQSIDNDGDMQDFNPHNLPLLRDDVVNYNPVVAAIIVKYLRTDQELLRFWAAHDLIGTLPRVKTVDGISNFRDLGGWPVYKPTFRTQRNPKAKYSVRPNLMYRCANTAFVTDSGLGTLREYGVKTVFDLRSEEECIKDGIPENLGAVGIERVHAPVFRHEDYSPEAIALRFSKLLTSWYTYVQIYDQMLENGTDLFRSMFTHLLQRPDAPMMFHCTAGKDRTGVFGMLVLRLAGVDRFTISKEYALTTYGLVPDHGKIKEHFLHGYEKLQQDDRNQVVAQLIIQGRDNWSIEVDGFSNLISSRAEAMLATMDLLDTKYGGVLNYMGEYLKFSKAEIEAIFNNIVCTELAQPVGRLRANGSNEHAKF